MDIQLTVNGSTDTFDVKSSDTLIDVLRQNGYTGVKRGCDTGDCGFCTVIIDGEAKKSCIIPAREVDGSEIETIEGLGSQDDLHIVQKKFVEHAALQCGFCTPGMIMAATAFLRDNPNPNEEAAREAIDDVLCRCTGYEKPVEAILDAAEVMNGSSKATADGGSPVVEPQFGGENGQ